VRLDYTRTTREAVLGATLWTMDQSVMHLESSRCQCAIKQLNWEHTRTFLPRSHHLQLSINSLQRASATTSISQTRQTSQTLKVVVDLYLSAINSSLNDHILYHRIPRILRTQISPSKQTKKIMLLLQDICPVMPVNCPVR